MSERPYPQVVGDWIEMMSVLCLARLIAVRLGLALLLVGLSAPAMAHKGHKKEQPAAAQVVHPGAAPAPPAATQTHSGHNQVNGMMADAEMDRSEMPFFVRLLDWFGRLHPAIVHFPIAFFPAALFTAIVGRRRPAFAAPVQFLVVAGGIFAPIAAAAGWIAGLSAEPDQVLTYHRWLGVALGIAGAGLGVWAWKRPWEDRGTGMIAALTLMTAAIAAQGFLGAAVTHGMEHLMF
ncbi:hypothetical protein G7076_04850 [Sphingomonas sp. HDW15A]|uniref:DUF2231 domain-containing protein n=1 Tax=Sphingomonas sp. HDW15A TaxID=2714942 RepID=UPI00140E39F5|nr:DUF2231 domain-containing protein [Sphingomonas sp. HDW15A]QIK95884.1 hypothetical protein G7076_04850 [Sphingomonas sp. HDW15A]